MKQSRAEHRHEELPARTATSQILVPIIPASSTRRNLNPRGGKSLAVRGLWNNPKKTLSPVYELERWKIMNACFFHVQNFPL